jgi:hypothetical protein
MFRWDSRTKAYRVQLDPGFRGILRQLMQQLIDLLADPGAPVMHRVFPPAYSDPADVGRQDEYRQLMQDDLAARRRAEAETVLETVDSETLTEEQLLAWSRSVNSLRLALGTYLDVTEDERPGAPESPEESVYQWLSYVLDEAVEALSRQAP